jgi:hypothetical protein
MKVIVKLAGGIGNQLFQYVFAKGITNKFNAQLLVDVSSFENYSYHHDFELKKLLPEITIADSYQCTEKKGTYFLDETINTQLSNINILPEDCEILVISGYWQDEKYIDGSVVSEIYNKLTTKFQKITDAFQKKEMSDVVGLHIRRRDYKHMGLCSEEYYIGSLQYLMEANSFTTIFLFSDEPNYSLFFLNKYFNGKIKLINTGNDFHDLFIMSQCNNIVISNSTYSWWGAFFNEANKNIIINPDPWILLDNTIKPCPSRWISVTNSLNTLNLNFNKINEIKNQIYCSKMREPLDRGVYERTEGRQADQK